jgi:hypothetical protein
VPPTRRRQCICDPTNVVDENNSVHGVHVDIEHGYVEDDIAHGVVQCDDLLAKCIKDIIDQHEKKGRTSLEMLNVMYY